MLTRLGILHVVMHFRMLLYKLPARPARLANLVDPALDFVLRALLFLHLLSSVFVEFLLAQLFSLDDPSHLRPSLFSARRQVEVSVRFVRFWFSSVFLCVLCG